MALPSEMSEEEVFTWVNASLKQGLKQQVALVLWPWLVQNEWRRRIYAALDAHDYVAIMGHGSASKTFTATEWFLLDWWTEPESTALAITSDTLGSMDRRIWSDIKTLWSKTAIRMPGILIDSKRMIVYSQLDKKNAIAGMAAEDKDSQTKIQGLHTKRVRVIIDEADNKDSQSIWKALSNLSTSGHFKVCALANPANRQSEFGQHCEPPDGWASINPEVDMEWKSKAGWQVLRLDGLNSPNVTAGYDKFPFLLTRKAIEEIREKKGVNSLEWWTYVRAMYSPQGDARTIFTPALLLACRKPLTWYAQTEPIATCDPALEEDGDSCVLSLGLCGRLAEDTKKWGLKLEEQIKIFRKDLSLPASMDKGNQILKILKEKGVSPDHFAIDCTGEGLSISDHIKTAWEPGKVVPTVAVRFGQGATEMLITTEHTKKAFEIYDRFVTELWYGAREWAQLGLVWMADGLPRELTTDLESREYSLDGAKDLISIETKRIYKKRTKLPSCDHGDSFTLMPYLVRLIATGFKPGRFVREKGDALASFKKKSYVFNASYGVVKK